MRRTIGLFLAPLATLVLLACGEEASEVPHDMVSASAHGVSGEMMDGGGGMMGGAGMMDGAGGTMGDCSGMAEGGMAGAGGSDGESPLPPSAKTVGDACTTAAECPAGGSGTPICLSEMPGGTCAVAGCADHGHDCPGDSGDGGTVGAKCVKAPENTCLLLCTKDADCRAGYGCLEKLDAAGHGTARVCFPL